MVTAITMVKDEADVIEDTVRRMTAQVDHVIVADNGSSDGTREILAELAAQLGRIEIYDDTEPGYYQSQKMTLLAGRAAAAGATWVVPFDADEVWLSRDGQCLGQALAALPQAVLIAQADLYDHVATALDPTGPPLEAIQWRRPAPGPLPKVACRVADGLVIHQGNHSASYAHTDLPPTVTNLLTVRHFPYRSVEQMARKASNGAAAYAATDLPEDAGGHWRGYGRALEAGGEQAIADIFHTWFWRERPGEPIEIAGERQPPLVHDPLP